MRLFLMILLLCAGLSYSSQLQHVNFLCNTNRCSIQFAFKKGEKFPLYLQKWNSADNELQLYFSNITFAEIHKTFVVPKSEWLKSVEVGKTISGDNQYTFFKMRFFKKQNYSKVPVTIVSNSLFQFEFNGLKENSFVWTLNSAELKSSKVTKSTILPVKKVEVLPSQPLTGKSKIEPAAQPKKEAAPAAKQVKRDSVITKVTAAPVLKTATEPAGSKKSTEGAVSKKVIEPVISKKSIVPAPIPAKALVVPPLEKNISKTAPIEKKNRVVDSLPRAVKSSDTGVKTGGTLPGAQKKQLVAAPLPVEENTLLCMSYMKNNTLKRFYFSFFKPEIAASIRHKNGVVILEFTKLTYAPKLKDFVVPGNDVVKSVQFKKKDGTHQIHIELNTESSYYRLFKFENKIIIQSAHSAPLNKLFFWSSDREAKTFEQVPPPAAKKSLAEFKKEVDSANEKRLSTGETFVLGTGIKELIAIGDKVRVRSRPEDQASVVDYLNFGERVTFVDFQDNWYKVTYKNKSGYVYKTLLSYEDKLTREQGEKLIAQVNSSNEKFRNVDKNKVPVALTIQEEKQQQKAREERKAEIKDSVKVTVKTEPTEVEEKIKYSSYGRRDPFIPVTGPDDSGINIDGIKLVGIIWDKTSPIAIFEDIRNTGVSYTLQMGDKILNGKVEKITATEVVFGLSEFGVERQYSMSLPEN